MPSQIGTAVSELLVRHFLKFVLLWVIIILGLAAAFAVTFIMMLIIFHDHQHDECDVPLRIFVWVVITSIAYYNSLHFIIQRYLGYRTDIDTQIPERVVRYGLFCQCCNLLLYITGLVFLAEAKSCQKTAPQLYKAVNLFVSIAVSFSVVCTVNSMYVAIFMYLVRTGHVTTSDAAPQAIKMCRVVPLEEILPERQSNDEEGKDLPECPICMEAFNDSKEIRRTPCNHNFHSECLESWLKVSRRCPLCRHDFLGQSADHENQESDLAHPTSMVASSSSSSSSGSEQWQAQAQGSPPGPFLSGGVASSESSMGVYQFEGLGSSLDGVPPPTLTTNRTSDDTTSVDLDL